VSVCLCVCLSVCRHSHSRISLSIFTKLDTKVLTPKSKNEFVGAQYRPTPFPIFPLKISVFDPEVLKIHANMKNAISALNVHVSPKFLRLIGNWGRKLGSGNTTVTSDFWLIVDVWLFHACTMKYMQFGRIAKIPESYRKSGSANMMVTSDFWQQVEIWLFRACTMKKYAIWPWLVNSAMEKIPCSTERISCLN